MTDVLSQPAAHALARALGHFVWQGAAIGLFALIASRIFRASASARYVIGVSGLVAMLAAPVVTFPILAREPQAANVAAAVSTVTASLTSAASTLPSFPNPAVSLSSPIDWQAVVLIAWMIGAAAFTLRLTGGWVVARRFATRAVRPASEQIVDVARGLTDRMGVRRAVAIVESAAVSVPVMIGWLKPTIVLPVAALAGLSPSQIEALIAHELAHVKRHDYLVNLLQSSVEALLFYHPAVWWLSRRVRAERELCCDDLAVRVCDRLVYATALTDLASMASPGIALAATDGDLIGRVRRILGRGQTSPAAWPGVAPLLALAFVAAVVVPAALASTTTPQHPGTIIAASGDESAAPDPQTRPTPSQSPSASPSPKPQTAESLELLKAQQEDLQRKLEEVRRQINQLRDVSGEKQAKNVEQAKADGEADLKALQQQLERTKALQEKGLTSQAKVEEIQALLSKMAAERQGNEQAVREAEFKAMQQQLERTLNKVASQGDEVAFAAAALREAQNRLARGQTLFDKGLANASTVGEMKDAVAVAERQLIEAQQNREREGEAKAKLDRLQADERALNEMAQSMKTRVVKLDEATPAQVGDTLTIRISSEPTLPSGYAIAEDGTIRFPFVGSVKVVGLTTSQAREAIGKRLAEKKLGSVDQVTVSIMRPWSR